MRELRNQCCRMFAKAASVVLFALMVANAFADSASDGELLYNGIRLPKEWPPKTPIRDFSVRPIPYLQHPPTVISIDVGRQLFVDDFLIEKTDLARTYHHAEKFTGNPIFQPQTALESKGPVATVFNDGVWFDPKNQSFKMWSHAGWFEGTGYATSKDGFAWTRPQLDVVPGSNRVLPVEGHGHRDGNLVWMDSFSRDPQQRFKMYIYERPAEAFGGRIFTSPDGLHWNDKGKVRVGTGDNTTIFYNPFRKKWVYSVRLYRLGRARDYWECDDIARPTEVKPEDCSPWFSVDELDKPDPGVLALMPTEEEIKKEAASTNKTVAELTKTYRGIYGDPPQLYNVDAVAYESVMLGVFGILKGPTSSKGWEKYHMAKILDLELGYSRDGFHFSRPDRTPFLASSRKEGTWDFGYLHSAGGICNVVGDKLYFFYGGWSGLGPKGPNVYAGGAVGVAFLRRDGFASMDAAGKTGSLVTRPVTFKGKYLFANADASKGNLRAEVLDEAGKVIEPFSLVNCIPISADGTKQRITWKNAEDLSKVAGQKVKLHFQLERGELYAFWVTPDVGGASFGYVAAGGPGFVGPMDDGFAK